MTILPIKLKGKGRWPLCIPKTTKVFTVPPYSLVVEYEDGKKRMLDLCEIIDLNPRLHILKVNPELFSEPSVSLCGYQTAWETENLYLEFHNDFVYAFGDDFEIKTNTL